jgi:hypothetical protein
MELEGLGFRDLVVRQDIKLALELRVPQRAFFR